MSKRFKKQTVNGGRSFSQPGSTAITQSQIEAHLLSREILRRIRRTSTLFAEVPDRSVAHVHKNSEDAPRVERYQVFTDTRR